MNDVGVVGVVMLHLLLVNLLVLDEDVLVIQNKNLVINVNVVGVEILNRKDPMMMST